jgi:hypothetical protein
MSDSLRDRLNASLAAGPLPTAELRRRLEVSQPTLSRLLRNSRADVAVLARGRATRYGWLRRVRELEPEIPVYRISSAGRAARIGTLTTLAPDRIWHHDFENPGRSAEHRSIPWFMTDMRPQGYLGRLFPASHEDLHVPPRVTDWNEDQTLYALARRGEDCVGNLVVGEESLARWTGRAHESPPVSERDRRRQYDRRARATMAGHAPGSSAAGEQPKFTATLRGARAGQTSVIVKFSPPPTTASGKRWADLLVAECVAGEALRAHGHAAASSRLLQFENRSYLEVERFDRVGERGRQGLVSLGALDDEFVGERRGWSESAAVLLRLGMIQPEEARELRFLAAFGELIANTDMHLGNASFLMDDMGRLQLAPVYDMLPMMYAPLREEVPREPRRWPTPGPATADQWAAAVPVARDYWSRMADDRRASADFRRIAVRYAQRLTT